MPISDDAKYIAAAVLTSAALNKMPDGTWNDEKEVRDAIDAAINAFNITLDRLPVELQ